MADFSEKFNIYFSAFEDYINESFTADNMKVGSEGAAEMFEAMDYSLRNGGKRIRPVLALAFCEACGGDYKEALPFALGAEMIHTYSLIHDDLPCMDNDDMRRGKPSNHKVFGYPQALLAGDGLLTLAFEILSSCSLPAEKRIEGVKILSESAGFRGMIAGQAMDMKNESGNPSFDTVKKTDALKTGELIKAASLLGCVAAGADEEQKEAAREYSLKVGLAFQILDDILDVTSSSEDLGKPAGSDIRNDKVTYVSLLGVDGARSLARSLTDEAVKALDVFGNKGGFLKQLALNLADRKK
ncbi:MAG: polyprenyl synthetase family protein [Clostridia bacterium]|nr:polyprenyl synthetase family protein [Clostridia bacterium]